MQVRFLGLTQTKRGSFGRGETLDLDPEEAKDLARLSTVELVDEVDVESDPAVEFIKENTDLDPEEVLDGIKVELTKAGNLTSATKKAIKAKIESWMGS